MPRKKREVPWLDKRGYTYYACWYDPKTLRTQRKSLATGDPTEAQARFALFLQAGQAIYAPQATNGLTVAAALKDYYSEHRITKLGGHAFENGPMAHLVEHLGRILIQDVDVPTCREYVRVRTLEGASPGTIRGEVANLLTAAKHAVKWKRLKLTEMPQVEVPAAGPPRERWLTHAELQALRETIRPSDARDFVDLCYWTASRKTAILMLTKFQVNLTQQRIRLSKPGEAVTKKRRPVVPIAPELLPVVQRLCKETEGEYLLPKRDYDWHFDHAVEKLGLIGVSPHTLRHTRITHLLQQGVAPWAVAGLAGLNLMTLVTVYGHHCPDHLQEVIQSLKRGSDSGA
jgi:integrase